MFRQYSLISVLLLSLTFNLISGCDREGPAEKAGEKIDNAAEQIGDKAEDAGEAARDKMQEAGDALQKSGQQN